jgi:hypothetical protein
VHLTLLPIGSAPSIEWGKNITVEGESIFEDLRKLVSASIGNIPDVHLYVQNIFEPSYDEFIGDIAKMVGKSKGDESQDGYSMNIYYSVGKAYL